MPKAALLVVDVQNDFCPGGALPVPDGDSVIPSLNRATSAFGRAGLPIFFTRDWHPPNHCSFMAYGGIWPTHCVQGTTGAAFHPSLVLLRGSAVISKGDRQDAEAYSGFQGTDLATRLKKLGVKTVYLGGLAVEYCVRTTAEDALKEGFRVAVLSDCIKGLEIHHGDSSAAIEEMKRAGATVMTSQAAVKTIVGTQQ